MIWSAEFNLIYRRPYFIGLQLTTLLTSITEVSHLSSQFQSNFLGSILACLLMYGPQYENGRIPCDIL